MTYDKSKEMEQQAWVADKYNRKPALAALTGLIASFPIPKIFASNAVPLLMWRESRQEQRVQRRLAGRL
ncbi:DEKNAAC104390 [Brettanomyces naardenensis]|uniref:DEKNAAC104390 n=1 Tax=Brettanomyces naardenensis TaxID=13370 RepID=A0A448YQQ5_BRENA|nr:DEKNAAC104390 [Brettanomyces naardenensis]